MTCYKKPFKFQKNSVNRWLKCFRFVDYQNGSILESIRISFLSPLIDLSLGGQTLQFKDVYKLTYDILLLLEKYKLVHLVSMNSLLNEIYYRSDYNELSELNPIDVCRIDLNCDLLDHVRYNAIDWNYLKTL